MLLMSTKQSYNHGSGNSRKDRTLWSKQYPWKVRAARNYWSPYDSMKSPRYRTFVFSERKTTGNSETSMLLYS